MRALLCLGTAALAGCVGGFSTAPPPSRIEASESGLFIPSVRASIGRAAALPPSQPQNGGVIEFGASRTRGSDQQALAAGQQPVRFGGQTFTPPADLTHDFDFSYLEASWRGRLFVNDVFGVEVAGGLAYAMLDLAVASGTQRASEAIESLGATLGAGFVLRLGPSTSVQTRVTFYDSASYDDISSARRFELFVAQSLGRNVGVRAGYSAWKVESERNFDSPIKLSFSGPSLGLELMF